MSANIPPSTVCGAEAPKPHRNRKASRAGQFGAKAQAIVKRVYMANEEARQIQRPNDSLRGPNTIGPNI